MDMIPIADYNAGIEKARAEATFAERERIGAILNCNAAKDRPNAAKNLALTSDVTAAMANSVLGAVAAETTSAPSTAIYGQRSQDAPGGLVIDGAPSEAATSHVPRSDHDAGRMKVKEMRSRSNDHMPI